MHSCSCLTANSCNATAKGTGFVHSMQVDTGTEMTLVPEEYAPSVANPKKVDAKILVAEASTSMPAELMGDVFEVHYLNVADARAPQCLVAWARG